MLKRERTLEPRQHWSAEFIPLIRSPERLRLKLGHFLGNTTGDAKGVSSYQPGAKYRVSLLAAPVAPTCNLSVSPGIVAGRANFPECGASSPPGPGNRLVTFADGREGASFVAAADSWFWS